MNTLKKVDDGLVRTKHSTGILITAWSGILLVSIVWNVYHQRQEILAMACVHARIAHQKDVTYRRWNAEHGGVYVPVTKETPSNPYLDVPERDITTPSGRLLTLMNPAYMTRQVHEMAEETFGSHAHITSLKPIRPANAADAWESEALKAFERGAEEVSEVVDFHGEPHMRLMRPLITEEGCLKCHSHQGYKLGDIRGGISISLPMAPLWATWRSEMVAILVGHVLIWLIGLVGIVLGTRSIARQETKRERAEEELRERTALNQMLLDSLPCVALLLRMPDRVVVAANKAGRDAGAVPGEKCFATWGQREEPCPWCLAPSAMATGESQHLQVDALDVIWDAHWYRLGEDLYLHYAFDVTEEVRSREELARSQKLLKAVVEQSPVPMAIAYPDGTLFNFNDACMEMLGIMDEPDLGPGTNLSQVQNLWKSYDKGGNLIETQATALALALQGKATDGSEIKIVRKDGTEKWAMVHAIPITAEDGTPIAGLTIFPDITEIKLAQEALKESEEKYRMHFENVGDVVYSIDREYRITSMSPSVEQAIGYRPEEMIGRKMGELGLLSPEHLAQAVSNAERVFAGETVGPTEYEFIAKDGKRILVEVTAAPIMKNGRVIGEVDVARDITEHRLLEEQLRQSQKLEAIGQLAGGVAHDFNNLLTAIFGHTQLALMTVPEDNPAFGNLRQVELAANRAADLTQQLLAFGRKQVILPKVMDLKKTLGGLNTMLRRLIREDIDLVVNLDPDVWRIVADPSQMEQVFLNLVINARDAIHGNGQITIEAFNRELDEDQIAERRDMEPGRYVVAVISDTGEGMNEEVRERIFEPFFTTKGEGEGTGLGLATVYGIIKQHGGDIRVESEEGIGTRFHIYFPASLAEIDEEAPKGDSPQSPRGTETVFFVEDERSIREVGAKILSEYGYSVFEASGGPEALELMEKKNLTPKLLVTDIVMPGMNGKELAEIYKKRCPEGEVLFISGYVDSSIQKDGVLELGRNLLQKPFTSADLAQMVRKMLDG